MQHENPYFDEPSHCFGALPYCNKTENQQKKNKMQRNKRNNTINDCAEPSPPPKKKKKKRRKISLLSCRDGRENSLAESCQVGGCRRAVRVRVRRSDPLDLGEGVHTEPRAGGLAPVPLADAVHRHHGLRREKSMRRGSYSSSSGSMDWRKCRDLVG